MELAPALARSAQLQHGVLTAEQLKASGLKQHHVQYLVQRGFLIRAHRGLVVIAGSPETRLRSLAIAALAARPSGGASHRSSAGLFGMRTVDHQIDVTVRYPVRLTMAGVRVVRSRDILRSDFTWVDGVPTTTPERTICDLGLIFPESEVMRILRHAVATGLVNRMDVRRMRNRVGEHGRNGAGIVGRCLDRLPDLAEDTESGIETRFLEVCRDYGVEPPQTQLPVLVAGRLYRVDFAYVAERIFIEIDGRATHSAEHQIAADGGRQNDLVGAGWMPLRFTSQQLRDEPEICAATARQARHARICEPGSAQCADPGSQIA